MNRLMENFNEEQSKKYASLFLIALISLLSLSACNNAGSRMLDFNPFPGEEAPPKVLFSNPVTGTQNLPSDQKFTVVFSKSMNMDQCQIAFSISPNVNGFFSHTDVSLTFAPSSALKPGSYTFTVSKSCEDTNGRDILDPFSASVSIGSASTSGTNPSVSSMLVYAGSSASCTGGGASLSDFLNGVVNNGCTGNPSSNQIVINFSRDMNEQITQSAISITPNISAGYSWSSPSVLDIKTDFPLSAGQRYTVGIGTQAVDQNDIPLQGVVSSSFFVPSVGQSSEITSITIDAGTAPNCFAGSGTATDILSTSVSNACLGDPNTDSIVFTFPQAMDPSSTQSAISISPSIPGSYAWSSGNQVLTLTTDSKLTYSNRYTINIANTAKTSGLIALQDPIQASFVAGANNPLPHVQAIGLVSQGNCLSSSPIGSASGDDWSSTNACWWDDSLLVLSPSSYKFRGGDDMSYSSSACTDKTTDDYRIIFSTYMNTGSVISAISLTRNSPGGSSIQLSTWSWSDCQTTSPFGCRVLDLEYAESASSCGDTGPPATNFGTGGDFNMTNASLLYSPLPSNYPIYSLQISNLATDIENRQLNPAFNFSFVSQ